MSGKLYIVGWPKQPGITEETMGHLVFVDDPLAFRQPKGRLRKISRSLLVGRVPLPRQLLRLWFPKDGLDKLAKVTADDSVLFFEWMNARTLKVLLRLVPQQTACHIYYCNPIRRIFKEPARQIAALKAARIGGGITMSSFDPADARDFGLDYGGQFFDHAVSNADYVPTTDCFFCGLPKDRTAELSRLKDMLESQGCTCDFVVPQCREECLIGDQYYQRLSRARCLVDIVQKNQCGLTKRPLEALLYRKKLITNNPWVRHEDFYNPHNIFILGEVVFLSVCLKSVDFEVTVRS